MMFDQLTADPCGFLTAGVMLWCMGDAASRENAKMRKVGLAMGGITVMALFLNGLLHRSDAFLSLIASIGFGLFVVGRFWSVFSMLVFVFSCLPRPKPRPFVAK